MSLRRLLSPNALKRARFGLSALDDQALSMIDQSLMAAKKPGLLDKSFKGYNKAMQGAWLPNKLMYGTNMDTARTITPLGMTLGGLTVGGLSAKPFLHSLNKAYTNLAPEMAAAKTLPLTMDNMAMLKMPMALMNKPWMASAKALGSTGLVDSIAAHPYAWGFGAAPAMYFGAKKARDLVRALTKQRRLNMLRKGLAPKAYGLRPNQLQRLGLK